MSKIHKVFFFRFYPVILPALACTLGEVRGQVEIIEEDEAPRTGALQASPREDLFKIANMVYQQAQAEKGDIQERRRLLALAAARYEDYRRRFPGEGAASQAMYWEGMCLMELNKPREAQTVFQELTRTYKTGPYVAYAAYRLAEMAYKAKNYQSGLSYFSLASEQSDKAELRLSSLYMAATCYQLLNRKAEAASIFTRVVEDPQVSSTIKNSSLRSLAALDVEANRLDNALKIYQRIANDRQADVKSLGIALSQGVKIAVQTNRMDLARDFYSRLLSNPDLKEYMPAAQDGMMEVLYNEGKYDDVLKEMKRDPAPVDSRTEARKAWWAAKSAYELKKYNDAISYFGMVESNAPQTEQAMESGYYKLLSAQELKLPNFENMVTAFLNNYSVRYPQSPIVHTVRALHADIISATEPTKAVALFKQIDVSKLPVDLRPSVLLKQAWLYSMVKDHVAALKSLDEFISQYPTDAHMASSLLLRGKMYKLSNDEVAAMSDFNRIIQNYPKSENAASAWQEAAILYKDKQDIPNMIKYYEGLIENFPKIQPATIADAHYSIGKGYFDTKQYEKGVKHLEEARALLPSQFKEPVDIFLVTTYYELQDVEKLKTAYDRLRTENPKAAETFPDNVPAWLGSQCFAQKDYQGADKYLSYASDVTDPKKTRNIIWGTLAKARLRTGKFDRALAAVDFYLDAETSPGYRAQALLDKAVILVNLNKIEEAQAAAEEAMKIGVEGPVRAALSITLGDIQFAKGNFEEAARFYGTTASVFTTDRELKPQALYKAAVALEKAGKRTEADQFAKDLKSEFPEWRPTEDIFMPTN